MSTRGIARASLAHGLDRRGRTIARLDRRSRQRDALGVTITDLPRRPWFGPLFFEKIPEPGQLNDVFARQNLANQIRLWRGLNFIQMTLRVRLQHKLLDALVESAVNDHVGTRAERGANVLLVD
jgi:hypothetical protein